MMRNTGADLRALSASKAVTAAAVACHIRHGDTLATGGNICISQQRQRLAFVVTFGMGQLKMEVQAAALVITYDAEVKKHIAA